jgi:hypothetical protein
MKNIWNIGKRFTTKKHEVKINSSIKNKLIHFELNIKQKVINQSQKTTPTLNLEKIVENFQKNQGKIL